MGKDARRHIHRVSGLVCSWLVIFGFLAGKVSAGEPLILDVDTTIDSAALTACLDAVDGDCSLRGAVITANSVADGIDIVIELDWENYVLTLNGAGEDSSLTGDLDVLRSMTIRRSSGFPEISGGGSSGLDDRLIDIHGGGTVLRFEDVEIQECMPAADLHAVNVRMGTNLEFVRGRIELNGTFDHGGGAVRVSAFATASFDDTRILGNAGFDGAGVRSAGQLSFSHTQLRSNLAIDRGGAVSMITNFASTALFEDCHLTSNYAVVGSGGAVWANSGTLLTLRRSLVEENRAQLAAGSLGGGVYSRGEVVVEDSTFASNVSDRGSAIFVEGLAADPGHLDVVNSTFSANESTEAGGGAVVLEEGAGELLFTTHWGQPLDVRIGSNSSMINTASLFGGSCFHIGGTFISGGGNLAPIDFCWGGNSGDGDRIVTDLDLNPLGTYGGPTPTHLPRPTSPALDAHNGPCLDFDQRGLMRSTGPCDSGAVQRQRAESFVFGDDFEAGDLLQWSSFLP